MLNIPANRSRSFFKKELCKLYAIASLLILFRVPHLPTYPNVRKQFKLNKSLKAYPSPKE